MSDAFTSWANTTTEGVTTVPGEVSPQDGYVLLLVLLSIFIGGTLVLLFGILIVCRRCCETDRRHSRASDDPEKTNTTYLDDSQPTQDITIKVDDPECMSSSSYRDAESERFLSSGSATGRRVSFNEAALFEQSKKAQEKGRRYTLTEGDFHHLKNARLSHLPLPPSAALKIVTIHECESNENSMMTTPRLPPVKPRLAIFQSGSAAKAAKGAPTAPPQDPTSAPAQGTVLHFLTRLRRHASLEGASPYFRIKKWKLETSQRASSLDTRGSPKRHQFQRQRAASESMDQDRDPHQTDIIQYIARTDDVVFRPVAGPFLPAPASPTLSLGRLESSEPPSPTPPEPLEQQPTPLYHDIWSLRASLEKCVSSEKGNDQDSAPSDGGDSVSSNGGLPSFSSSLADEAEAGEDRSLAKPKQDSVELEAGTRKLLQMDSGYASIEAPSGRVGEDQTASEKRFCFTSAGRKATIFESFEGQEREEEEEEEEEEAAGAVGGLLPSSPLLWAPYGQMFPARESFSRRDYSIDEKTDALFNAFVCHDPQFDESPLRAKHRSRTHLRKQWQRTKQYSDPGVRYPTALERHRTPLRRGDSVNYPLEGRYHSTLPRIVSSGDEEVASPAAETGDKIQAIEEEPPEEAKTGSNLYSRDCLEGGQCPRLGTELLDKIAGGLEDMFFTHLKKPRESLECVVVVAARASPDHSPE
ncbi:voltage-dependent calcium channel beta subunit-associated regulatory protein isoform X2 [Crotalus tigris]|uniref:voltage-dependent calcium channel beta subunit-associated regulatory protein isoform X2 n=1 Tax=Crotalus tigris TaxID=88082 RepID=UPI00192F5432|nr:voltage-dependent calcium channel beta subunit-associated regulatory protein isoform X2 [Crotalus tigris]